MTTKLWLLLLLAIPVNIWAQDGSKLHLLLEARGDYQRTYVDKEAIKDDCGFKGKYLNVILTGDITPQVSYAYRQRLNKIHKNSSFFDATDWLYLNYQATQHLSFSGGKQVVGIGGYEYDRAPINLYFCSEFWNNIPCYQWGVSASYAITKNDKLTFQFCESPFRSFYEHADMYAYNLMWNGSHGIWNTIWSINMLEWQGGKFINYISLGNEFRLARNATLQLDYLNRAVSHQTFLFKDCWNGAHSHRRRCRVLSIGKQELTHPCQLQLCMGNQFQRSWHLARQAISHRPWTDLENEYHQ